MSNSTDHSKLLQDYIETKRTEYIPVFIFYGCIILFGITGNAFGLYFYQFKASKTVSSLFLASLAANDLFTSVVLFDKLYQLYKVGDFMDSIGCRILIYVNHVFVLNSGFIITAMNADRCQHVCFPFSKWAFSRRSAKISVSVLLALSSVISTSNLFLTDSTEYEITMNFNTTIIGYRCTHSRKDEHQTAITVFHFVDLVAVILTISSAVIIYSIIACKISKYKKELNTISQNTHVNKGFNNKPLDTESNYNAVFEHQHIANKIGDDKKTTHVSKIATNGGNVTMTNSRKQTTEIRITAMMFTMTLGTVLCVVPYFYISLVQHPGMTKDEFELSTKARLLHGSFAVYSTINPYVIGVFHTEFRAFAIHLLKSAFCCCLRKQ